MHGPPTRMVSPNSLVCLPTHPFFRSHSLTIIVQAIFPGYYQGRATHIHAKVFPEWKVLKNNTFMGSRVVHVGQFFFDDEINTVVDKVRVENTTRHYCHWLRFRCILIPRIQLQIRGVERLIRVTPSIFSRMLWVLRENITPSSKCICWVASWDKV